MTTNWWLPALNTEGLSQGDVALVLPVAVSTFPSKRLQRGTGKGGLEIWTPTQDQAKNTFLFEGGEYNAIVVSHSCDLDKKEKKGRVLIAPMRPLDTLSDDDKTTVLAQERVALMPLPDVGGYYADLRLISTTSRAFLGDDRRVASMSPAGVQRLQVQLAQFFLRLSPDALTKALAATAP